MPQSIEVPGLHHGSAPIPAAALVGPLLMSSGINGMDPATGRIPPNLPDQIRLVFENIRRIAESAGGTVADIAKCTFFVRSREASSAINAHWEEMYPEPTARPARHTLTQELTGSAQIQAEIIAYIRKDAS